MRRYIPGEISSKLKSEFERIDATASMGEQLNNKIKAELSSEISALRDALRPFAKLLQEHNKIGDDNQPIFQINSAKITLGDIKRAASLTSGK